MRVSSTDDVELEVHDLGGDGPDLLLTHGTGLHGLVWEPFAHHLHGFHVWSFDARAHGDSTAPVGHALECSPETEAEIYERGTGHRAFPDLHLIGCPVTVALGDEALVPAVFGRTIAGAIPDATVVSFPQLAHFGRVQDPEAVARSVVEAFTADPTALS